ncbi:hypothetical protein [Azospirillum doebereinerae]
MLCSVFPEVCSMTTKHKPDRHVSHDAAHGDEPMTGAQA